MPLPGWNTGANRQIGSTQYELLTRAARAQNHQIMIDPGTHNAEWCSMKRMVRRGLFRRMEFGSPTFGYVVVYEVTQAGRQKLAEYLSS